MTKNYYKVPFDFNRFFEQKDLKKTSLEDSISQYLSVIITTAFKEYKHDHKFGSEIWESDYDLLTNINRLKEQIKKSLSNKVKSLEKRLENIQVNVLLSQAHIDNENNIRLKKQLRIEIKGTIKKTNEPFRFIGSYYIAPLAYSY